MYTLQKFAWGYVMLFLAVTSLAYLPFLTNAQGVTLGLFRLELIDDALHFGSAVWAATAAWWSVRASVRYFKIFGVVYGLDGVCGLIFGNGYLDLGIFNQGPIALDLTTRIFANLPHIIIGGLAAFIGFVVSRQLAKQAV